MSGGIFITFEGGEGVGKSTQIQRLAAQLRNHGVTSTVSREPGGTPGAEAIRHVLLDMAAAESFGPTTEALLFAAARYDHVAQVIKPALAQGDVVLIDRFMDSTRVYQGMSNDLDPALMSALERVAIDGAVPDLTIILDLDPAIGLARAAERRGTRTPGDRFEKETVETHLARRAAFLKIAAAEPDRCRVIDASRDADAIAADVWQAVAPLLETRQPAAAQKVSGT